MYLRTNIIAITILSFLAVATFNATANDEGFVWQEEEDEGIELRWNGRPAIRYMMPKLDESSAERRNATFKPYHHVYSPDGKTLLTKGPGGLFPHHRGLFYGFNKITYGDGKTCDTWHCSGKSYQRAVGIRWAKSVNAVGPLSPAEEEKRVTQRSLEDASHCVLIDWHGQDGEVFAHEHRVLGVSRDMHHGVEGWEIDFASRLKSVDGKPIHLNGDPQHAGFQFRASQDVPDKTAKQTYYLRTDGKGKPGDYRNWDHTNPNSPQNAECENRPWNAICFVLDNKRYTVLYIDHPDNPKPARYSERDYGRFGSYFAADVTKEKPLNVHYRLWVQEGEMTVEQCNALQRAYVPDLEKEIREDPFN